MSEPPIVVIPSDPPRRQWLRPELVSSWAEFIFVSTILLVVPIRSSTIAAVRGSSSHFMQMLVSNHNLLWSIFWESLLLGLFLVYLRCRGWKPGDLRIGLGWWTSLQGVGLLFAAQIVVTVLIVNLMLLVYSLQTAHHTLASFVIALAPHIPRHSIQVSWLVIAVATTVNAFMEEIVCMGYIFNQLAARRGPAVALIGTVFLRVACHTYQDPIHLAGIAVLFSIYAGTYWYTRKLWPLIFAHLLLDGATFSFLKVHFG